jgi:hypothetical protein
MKLTVPEALAPEPSPVESVNASESADAVVADAEFPDLVAEPATLDGTLGEAGAAI